MRDESVRDRVDRDDRHDEGAGLLKPKTWTPGRSWTGCEASGSCRVRSGNEESGDQSKRPTAPLQPCRASVRPSANRACARS